MIDLNKLEELARAATPGPWFYQEDSDAYTHIVRAAERPNLIVASGCQSSAATGEPTGRFIAAANPAAVQELIDLVRKQEAALTGVQSRMGGLLLEKAGAAPLETVDTPEFVAAKDALIDAGVKSTISGASCDVQSYLAAEDHFIELVSAHTARAVAAAEKDGYVRGYAKATLESQHRRECVPEPEVTQPVAGELPPLPADSLIAVLYEAAEGRYTRDEYAGWCRRAADALKAVDDWRQARAAQPVQQPAAVETIGNHKAFELAAKALHQDWTPEKVHRLIEVADAYVLAHAASVRAAGVQPAIITLSGHQLRMALDLINPDGLTDRDQLDDELTFGSVKHQDDDGNVRTGMCCWNDDTDGVLPLDGEYPDPAKDNCPTCGNPWTEHEFAVPAPYCPEPRKAATVQPDSWRDAALVADEERQSEAHKLARILFGMVEGDGRVEGVNIYADGYSAPDGDVFVLRAAELLIEQAAESKELTRYVEHFALAAHPAPSSDAALPTDISTKLREYASNPGYSHNDYADVMRTAADECERFYGGMVAWKENAQQKDRTIIEQRIQLATIAHPANGAQAGDAGPFMYAIKGPDGSAYIDENCVSATEEGLYLEVNGLNDSPDAGYSIVPVFLAAAPQTKKG